MTPIQHAVYIDPWIEYVMRRTPQRDERMGLCTAIFVDVGVSMEDTNRMRPIFEFFDVHGGIPADIWEGIKFLSECDAEILTGGAIVIPGNWWQLRDGIWYWGCATMKNRERRIERISIDDGLCGKFALGKFPQH